MNDPNINEAVTCPWCGAPEKLPRDGARVWHTCGTYRSANSLRTNHRGFTARRSDECYLHEEIAELKAEVEKLKAENEKLTPHDQQQKHDA